jgi:hypothetical protein
MNSETAPTAVRPNGKPYTRRKPPRAIECEDCGGDLFYIVVRTHDIAEAEAIVPEGYRDGCDPFLEWSRETICMCGGGHNRDQTEDSVRGVPCVAFRPMGGQA